MDEKKNGQCKPVDMQDKADKATQESPDQAVNMGPGVTVTKHSDDSPPPSPGITTTKQPG